MKFNFRKTGITNSTFADAAEVAISSATDTGARPLLPDVDRRTQHLSDSHGRRAGPRAAVVTPKQTDGAFRDVRRGEPSAFVFDVRLDVHGDSRIEAPLDAQVYRMFSGQ